VSDRRLVFDHLSKRYGSVVALQGATFDVRAGELFGFVGSNGAGKTTAMRIALGVLAADEGLVWWNGAPITMQTRRHIGYMPEERGLYPKMKVGEQLIYLARLHGLSQLAAKRSMAEWTERLGVAGRCDDEVQKLSLGNQQRVQLAAALVHNPSILVLDEPFSGLDPVAVDVMSNVLLAKAAEGIPVVFSSHQLDLVERLCHRVGIIRSGQMVAVGTVDELRAGATVRLVVDAPQAGPDWADALPGVSLVGWEGHKVVLELDHGVNDQMVLQTALSTGPVREFTRRQASLTELFRNVVSAHEEAA
jgi:ABC-2 type transport system ATP-binding protein